MKLLTFAFVIQFIIACWPKIDIINRNLLNTPCTGIYCIKTRIVTCP